VILDNDLPAEDETVTASLSPTISGLSITGSLVTNSSGIVYFEDSNALICTGLVSAPQSTTLTITCSGISVAIPISIVDSLGGGGGGEDMTITLLAQPVTLALSRSSGFVLIGATNAKVALSIQTGAAILAFASSTPTVGVANRFIIKAGDQLHKITPPSGLKTYVLSDGELTNLSYVEVS
jgi:hypothetical protein